jgi:hypothetical protein
MQGFKSAFCSEKRVGIFPREDGTIAIEIARRIEEYSKLNLTNPSDILRDVGNLQCISKKRPTYLPLRWHTNLTFNV